jgi:phospholipid/cholesterol/gamma-HCH transport system substrate-binding protein
MSKSSLEWKVGVFVFIGLALVAGLLIKFSKSLTFGPTYIINLRSTDVNGLKNRASVQMSGVQVGFVADIQLQPDGRSVNIPLQIYQTYKIHQDALFIIKQSGFLGDLYIAITPTTNQAPLFQNGDVAVAEKPFDIQGFLGSSGSLIGHLQGTAANLSNVISDVQRLVLNAETLSNLSATVSNARVLTAEAVVTVDRVTALVDTNAPAIASALSNFTGFSLQLNELASGATNLLATNAPVLSQAVRNVETSSETLKTVMSDIQGGKGAVGKLLYDEKLSADLSSVAANLSVTSSNLNRLGLWGILWQRKPPKNKSGASAPAPEPLTSPKQSRP